jgi:EAL domain-containing protein (putative c-di-GMP-specific phosphodiesterase class I)
MAVASVARKIMELLTEHTYDLDGSEVYSSASIGIALYPQNGLDSETLLKHADTAMYEAKKDGRNDYHFFSEQMHQKAIERHTLEGCLHRALGRGEFFLVYQPQLDLLTGETVGMEALVRWQSPDRGLVSPAEFIPVAEDSGLIRPLGEWILRTACREAVAWQRLDRGPLRLAVNLSAQQFRQPDFVERIEEVLQETGLDPQLLELELTESVFMENREAAIEVLVDLKARGIQIAIDDFGTGYSSLSYLKNFPIDRIKIAQEFVRDIPADPNDMAIVSATIAMAESLGLKLIAEGVETLEQLEFLQQQGCQEMQGYYFSRPLPADQVADFCRQKPSLVMVQPAD